MRSNIKDLGPISRQWGSTFEGILLLKERPEQLFKKGPPVFTERWCRLKGNLLIFCRTPNKQCTDAHGFVLLEGYSITSVQEKEISHVFQLVFEAGDSPIVLAARSDTEREVWCRHLSRAGLMMIVNRLESLRDEICRRTGRDPLEGAGPQDDDESDSETPDKGGLELQFNCINLPSYSLELSPNACITLYVKTPPETEWTMVSRTEIVENSNNPTFLKTLFINEDLYSSHSIVKVNVIDVRDIRSNTLRTIAQALSNVEQLLNNSTLALDLIETTGNRLKDAQVVVKARQRNPDSGHCASGDIYSTQFRTLCDNVLAKSYSFPDVTGVDLKVVEYMGEPVTALDFPVEYLKQVIHEEHLLFDSLSNFASSKPSLERLRTDRLIGMKSNIESYEDALRNLSDHTGPKFRPSRDKNSNQLGFVPLNLHINRIAMLNELNNLVLFHDVITVGAFSAHPYRFKNGGMHRLAATYVDCLSDYATCTQSLKVIRAGLHHSQEVRSELTSLRSRLQPGQETIESDRLDKKIRSFKTLFSDQYLSDLVDLSSVHASHDTLRGLLSALPNTSSTRPSWIDSVSNQADALNQTLQQAWTQAAELLWPRVLEGIAPMGSAYDNFQYRHHTVLCHAVTSVVSGLLNCLPCWADAEWRQMAVCGVPLHFEGLLSTYGDETGMLEDMFWATKQLQDIRVFVRPGPKPMAKMISISECQITCPESVWANAPDEIRSRGRVKLHLHPYFFNVGINEQQTLAETLGKTALQDSINNFGLASLKAYFDRYTKHYGAPRKTCTQGEVYDALTCIQFEMTQCRSKPVTILRLAAEISWTLNAVRFTSCKSAKDRTSMALTLEQVRWLRDCVGMKPEAFDAALECMRRTGLRRENTLKNTSSRKYAMTRVQLLYYPKGYKPPVGTYGVGQT